MTFSLVDLTDDRHTVEMTNGHWSHIIDRVVAMPAGVFDAGGFVFYRDVTGNPSVHASFAVKAPVIARSCARAAYAYRRALKEATPTGASGLRTTIETS